MAQSTQPKPADPVVDVEVEQEAPKRRLMRVYSEDGSHIDVNAGKPIYELQFEKTHGRPPEGLRDRMWVLWYALGCPGIGGGTKAEDAFDTWLESVEEIDSVFVERPGKAQG